MKSKQTLLVDIHPGGYGGELPLLDPGGGSNGSAYFSRDGMLCDCIGVPALEHIMCYAFRGDNYGQSIKLYCTVQYDVTVVVVLHGEFCSRTMCVYICNITAAPVLTCSLECV